MNYFFEYMRALLGERYDDFLNAYRNKPRHKALRVNTRKISVERFKKLFGGELRQNPLCHNSFYTDVKPSLDPLYHAGLYYMQEPSASAAVAAFAPFIGKRVLDLCAAPGGKSTQAAEYTDGIMFCNDPEFKRVKALMENIERLGVGNAVVTCRSADDYVDAGFSDYFDTLIVDAPCSGGGMMRYESVPYSREIVEGCAARQRDILASAVKLLCGGGYMLYSTCTFAVEENENNVEYLCSLGMETVEIPLIAGTERGVGISAARRIYPMSFDGEGHFYCVLRKTLGGRTELSDMRKKVSKETFGALTLSVATTGKGAQRFSDKDFPECSALKPVAIGTHIPDFTAAREHVFDNGYALVHALDADKLALFGSTEIGERAIDYLCGGQIEMSAPRGYTAITYNGYALGLGYSALSGDGSPVIKNGYPKRLRVSR